MLICEKLLLTQNSVFLSCGWETVLCHCPFIEAMREFMCVYLRPFFKIFCYVID